MRTRIAGKGTGRLIPAVNGLDRFWRAAGTAGMALLLALVLISPVRADGTEGDTQKEKEQATEVESPQRANILFLINEDPFNYEATTSIPRFAKRLEREHNFRTRVIEAMGDLPALRFPALQSALSNADLLVIFFRRAALPKAQLAAIKQYLNEGNPLVGIRTANHAFTVRPQDGEIPEGHQAWPEFVPEILGSRNRGYGPTEPGTSVTIAPGARSHPILEGYEPERWRSTGNVYLTAPLVDQQADVLLIGKAEDHEEPIAWTRKAGDSRVFYTSLGHPADFGVSYFRTLLANGIEWALGMR